jgi:Tetratricopeptide repeat
MREEVLAKSRAILGDDHPHTLTSMHNLALMYRQQGKLTEDAKMRSVDEEQRNLGDDHPDTLASMHNLTGTYGDQGRTEELEKKADPRGRHVITSQRCIILLGDHG